MRLDRSSFPPSTARIVGLLVVTAMVSVAALPRDVAATADPKAVAKCQAGLAKAGAKFVGKKLGTLAKCTDGVFKCIQTVDETADAGVKRTACIVKARAKCGGALAAITAARLAFVAGGAKACAGLDAAQLIDTDGLGFTGVDCASFGGAVTDLASLTRCIAKQHDCLAGEIFQLQVPRALELLQFTPPDAVTVAPTDADALACLADTGGAGADVNDLALGKSVEKCQKAVVKIGTKLTSQRLGSLAKCVNALFACAETKTGDDFAACNDKAKAGCTKAFTKNDDASDAAQAAIGKACGDPAVFPALLSPAGGNVDALLPSGLTTAPRAARLLSSNCLPLTTVVDYERCIASHLVDFADTLVNVEAPRTDQLLSGVGCTVDGCGGPIPTPTSTPSPTVSNVTRILDATGDGTHTVNTTRAIAVDTNHNVYVVAAASNNAFKITPAGTVTQIIGPDGDGLGHTLSNPIGVGVGTNGTVYVGGRSSNNVFKITSTGTITQILDAAGDGTHGVNGPNSFAIGSDDTVYVTCDSSGVFKIAVGGGITQILSPADGVASPDGIAVDAQQNVYVASEDSNKVFKITSTGTVSTIATGTGDGTHPMHFPYGLAISGTTVFVAAGFENDSAVFKITDQGDISQIFDENGDGLGHTVEYPTGLATDAAGNVYVTDDQTSTAFQITPGGTITRIFAGNDGAGHKALFTPDAQNIVVDDPDTIYVAGGDGNNAFKIVLP